MLDTTSLRLLHEVARTGSYTAAARELGYSQPAASYKMRALERATGVTLVVRVCRGMRLTPAGELLAEHARAVLTALHAAEQALDEIKGTPTGRVRIAGFQSACAVLLPSVIATLRRELPEVAISLTEALPPKMLGLLRAGEVDIGVTFSYDDDLPDHALGPDAAGLTRIPLLVDRAFIQLPLEHPLAEQHSVPLSALAQERWVVGGAMSQERLGRACEAAGFTPVITTTAADNLALEALVANGLGISLKPGLLSTHHHDQRVVNRLLDGWPARHIFALIWPDMIKVPAVRHVLDSLCAMSRGLQEKVNPDQPAS